MAIDYLDTGSYTLDETITAAVTSTEEANDVTGSYTLTQTSSTDTSQDDTTGDSFDRSETDHDDQTLTQEGDNLTGSYTLTLTDSGTTTIDETAGSFTLHQTGSTDSTQREGGNTITGSYSLSQTGTESTTLTETGDNDLTISQSDTDSVTLQSTGNRISGDATQTQTSNDSYTLSQEGGLSADSSDTYSLSETGTTGLTTTITVDAINGNTTLSQTASDSYTLIETGSNDDFATFTQTIQGSDNANLSQNSNWRSGEYSLNGSATGTATDTTVGTLPDESDSTSESDTTSTSATDSLSYQMSGDGNPLVGSVSMDTSDNRYDKLIIEIPNGAQAVDGQQPGTVDFRPFGKPYVEAGMPGNQTQTGTGPGGLAGSGAASEIAQSAAVSQPGAGFLMGAGNAQTVNGSEWSGSSRVTPYADIGREQYLQACFRAGTGIRTSTGTKLAEEIRPGDLVLSRSEMDPDSPLEVKPVEEVFVRIAAIINLHIGGKVIGTTDVHPFFREGDGWVPCVALKAGDRIRLEDGWGLVEGVADSGEVTTVYNWRIADSHTYFVGSREWGFSVWAHNTYVRGDAEGAERRLRDAGIRPEEAYYIAQQLDAPGVNGTLALNQFLRSISKMNPSQKEAAAAAQLSKSAGQVAMEAPMLGKELGSGAHAENLVWGGRHRDTAKAGEINGTESHHLIADEVSPIATADALAIRMYASDHQGWSLTWGGSAESIRSRQMQEALVVAGNLEGALQLGIEMVQAGGPKHDTAIDAALASAPRNSSGGIDWTKFRYKT